MILEISLVGYLHDEGRRANQRRKVGRPEPSLTMLVLTDAETLGGRHILFVDPRQKIDGKMWGYRVKTCRTNIIYSSVVYKKMVFRVLAPHFLSVNTRQSNKGK